MKSVIVTSIALSLTASAQAALVVSEPFDYTAGTNNLNAQSGGTGFSGAWNDASATDNLSITTGSITPSATMRAGYATSGNKLQSPTGAAANLDFTATRSLSNSINLDAASTTYFSFLVLGDWTTLGNSRGFNVGFTGSSTALSSNAVTIKKDFNTQNLIAAVGGTNTGSSVPNSLADNTATLVIGKLVTTNGADTLSFISYAGAEAVATTETWDSSNIALGSLTGSLTHLAIAGRVNDTGMFYRFDEVRVGDSWDDVTGVVPEPTSLAGVGLVAMGMLRRRR